MFDERLKSLRKNADIRRFPLQKPLAFPKELLLCGRLVNVPRILKP